MSWDLPSPFIHERVAHHAEIDGYGHVNNVVYVAWMDDCAWAHSTERGIPPDLCRQLNRKRVEPRCNGALRDIGPDEAGVAAAVVFSEDGGHHSPPSRNQGVPCPVPLPLVGRGRGGGCSAG